MLGEHTDEVLRELLDFNEADIQELKDAKTVASADEHRVQSPEVAA